MSQLNIHNMKIRCFPLPCAVFLLLFARCNSICSQPGKQLRWLWLNISDKDLKLIFCKIFGYSLRSSVRISSTLSWGFFDKVTLSTKSAPKSRSLPHLNISLFPFHKRRCQILSNNAKRQIIFTAPLKFNPFPMFI